MAQQNATSHERRAGLLLIGAAAVALILANSPAAGAYRSALHSTLGPLTLHHWIADGGMALFFMLVGLEVKREWRYGQLATRASRRLPFIAAASGMAAPAVVYLTVIGGDPALFRGWAIPAATDIAFALGVLALLGGSAPAGIKLILVTIAIIDDIGAVLIIAVFYAANLNAPALLAAGAILGCMFAANGAGVRRLWPYLLGFAALWLAVFQSGVHATIAGVLAALTVPLGKGEGASPLERLEHSIHPLVMFGVVPLFGLTSAGVTLNRAVGVISALPLAVALGLFIGKQAGVFGAVWLADRTGISAKPANLTWAQIYAASLLCGIGFTMSLFIGDLAFADPAMREKAKIGTLAGSLLAVAAGWSVLRFAKRGNGRGREEAEKVFGEDL